MDLWKHNSTYQGGARALNQSWACNQTLQTGCAYVDDIFLAEVLSVVAAHDPATPLFLSWTPHGVHSPLEVPAAYLSRFNFITDPRRRFYAAMVAHVDAMVGRVAAALKAKGMWDDLLWLTAADNGGRASASTPFTIAPSRKRAKLSNPSYPSHATAYANSLLKPGCAVGATTTSPCRSPTPR